MLLTSEDKQAIYKDWLNSITQTDEIGLIEIAEAAILKKLADAELPPLPDYECGPHTGHFAVRTDEGIKAYGRQAYAQGAAAQLDRLEKAEKDAERYRWLRERYTAVNFDWEESDQQAVIFTADYFPVATASCDETIDCAMEASK